MAGFSSIGSFVTAVEDQGQREYSQFSKVTNQAYVNQRWVDLSMVPSAPPRQNIYPGGLRVSTAKTYTDSGNIWHGSRQTPRKTFLNNVTLWSTAASASLTNWVLQDICMFYALIDMDDDAPQALTNSIQLPRYYANACCCQMYLVVTDTLGATPAYVSATYTNSQGVPDRVTPPVLLNANAQISSIATGTASVIDHVGPYLPLQDGDRGVRSVESIKLSASCGAGWCCLVLVKPLYRMHRTAHTSAYPYYPVEMNALGRAVPIHDEACLNFLVYEGNTLASGVGLLGMLEFVTG